MFCLLREYTRRSTMSQLQLFPFHYCDCSPEPDLADGHTEADPRRGCGTLLLVSRGPVNCSHNACTVDVLGSAFSAKEGRYVSDDHPPKTSQQAAGFTGADSCYQTHQKSFHQTLTERQWRTRGPPHHCSGNHSSRSATIGSTRDALRAGHREAAISAVGLWS